MKRFLPLFLLLVPSLSLAWMNTDYYQAGSNVFVCASTTTAPGASPAGITVTNPPLIVSNPGGSGVKLVIQDIGVDYTNSPAAASGLFLAYNLSPSSGVASGTPGTFTSAFVGQSTGTFISSKAGCFVSGILPSTPVFFRALGGTTGAAAIGGSVFSDSTGGRVVVPPGGVISLGTTSASTIMGHITWIEVPY